ncbi:Cas1p-domain-containing protein [Didymella exigua CBS 183.55]|uniref:Cas1p-domain-containing protein n=1 Tax=Didymella exigua CBS 183.55 TaxID=1150837 RepID=A0A6A5R4S6_9PLEO|nr:Cas1p-domain-containing protein [Didymella exigua CBS 183.55]KAF1922702.1 Cas1p-domain-containing protein [Didymella exigua CBS 183.55]
MTADWPETVGESGLHVTNRIAKQMANIVLNYRCNAKSAQKHGYPFSRTCCSAYRPVNWVQIIATILSAPLAALTVTSLLRSPDQRSRIAHLADALAVFMLAAVYCFIADRTHVFDKIPKEFANIDFRVMLGVTVLTCLFNVQSVPSPATAKSRKRSSENAVRSVSFLPREISEEFKGWMQIYVLVYAYTGASDVMDFFKVFRIFIALYLLLSGYGHATYFLRTNDFSVQRVLGVVLRLNTLPVLLALAMDRPYTSYYFAPLTTFWFLVVFLTLRIGRQWNNTFGLLLVKVVLAGLVTTMFVHAQGILELWASFFGIVFRANIDVGNVRSHLGMDQYVVFVGILVALVNVRVRSILRTPHKHLDDFGSLIKQYFVVYQVLLLAFAIITIPTFLVLMQLAKVKGVYEWWVPYTAWLPALSFVVLRNATAYLRARYCTSFAWLGRVSLEVYILSQHIWLAGDGKGVLRIGFRYSSGMFLNDKWRDVVFLTPILVWMAWKVHGATNMTTAWLIHGQETAANRQQQERAANGDVMELPGWHRSDSESIDDVEGRRKAQKGERKKMFYRVGGVFMALWLVNLLYP